LIENRFLKKPAVTLLLFTLLIAGVASANAPVKLTDSSGYTLVLTEPAKRVISLAPNLTELIYSVGAGDRLVAVSDYSDYPPAAKKLPRIGSAVSLDIERLVALKPDLVLTWKTGTPKATQDYLRQLKLPVFELEFQKIGDIARGVEILGQLTGHDARANAVSRAFQKRLDALRQQYEKRAPVSVFYQMWNQPLMTANSRHFISDMIRLCGGRNVFGNLHSLVSTVDIESVIGRSPEVIIAATGSRQRQQWLSQWSRWKAIPAVKNNKIFFISPDILSRPSTRILQGAATLCRDLQSARQSR
jgi:iron complex transport system substrate-binding protein